MAGNPQLLLEKERIMSPLNSSNCLNLVDLMVLQENAKRDARYCMVGGLILNKGRIFFQKRAPDRHLFPGAWDIAGGSVEEGETLYIALEREIREETGWNLTKIFGLVHQFDWQANNGDRVKSYREFDFLVEVSGDLDKPRLEKKKFTRYAWLGEGDIDTLKEGRENDVTMYNIVKKAFEFMKLL